MTSSAPSDRTRSSFCVLDTPVTFAPRAFAICTAKVPTPPDAPTTRTCWPAFYASTVAQRLQCGDGGDGHGGGLLEAQVRRHPRELVRFRRGVLGERSTAC